MGAAVAPVLAIRTQANPAKDQPDGDGDDDGNRTPLRVLMVPTDHYGRWWAVQDAPQHDPSG